MQEVARWNLDRLYSNEDFIYPLVELKAQYSVAYDVETLSKLIQAIEKAEYYLYCRSAEETVSSEVTIETAKVKELKREVQEVIQQSEAVTSDNINA
ncbi:oligoendopeptidase F, partial [Klebsiella pneumoniae]|nr:oligoendopeptidase F [Klebsiella pneumoniae]